MKLLNRFNRKIGNGSDFDIELLNETIEDLKANPNACTLYDVKKSKEDIITIPESNPSEQLSKFIRYLYDSNKMDLEYAKKEIKELQIPYMKYEDVITKLTSIIRGDRFCSGLIHNCVQSGEFLDLLLRLKEILMNEEDEEMEDNDLDKIVSMDEERKNDSLTISNDYILRVEHVPLHSCYGIIDRLKVPEPIVKEIPLEVNKIIDLDEIILKVLEINNKFVKLLLPAGLGVYFDRETYNQKKEEIIILNLNEKKQINRDLFDSMEWWCISFVNTSIKSSDGNQKIDDKTEITKLDFSEVKGETSEYYIEENGREKEKTKEVYLPDTEISEYEKNNIDQPIIMFKIISENGTYQLHFGKGWLNFSYNDNPQNQCFCTLNKLMFNDFINQVTELTSNWEESYFGENKLKTNWYLRELSGNKLTKNFRGENGYPDNWNEFLDYMIFFEKICKIYSKKN